MMIRVEIVANHSVEENIFEAFAKEQVGKYYTKFSNVLGVGSAGPRMGDAIWPEENFVLVIWCEPREAMGIKRAVNKVKEQFPDEGITFFSLPEIRERPASAAGQPTGEATQPAGPAPQTASVAAQSASTAKQPVDPPARPASMAGQPAGLAARAASKTPQHARAALRSASVPTSPAVMEARSARLAARSVNPAGQPDAADKGGGVTRE